ncbi:hypothetical protein F5887DRAFT_823869, partial [Amanita rubescens]
CELVEIMKITLQYTITHDEIDELEEKIIKWVNNYERYYYQHKEQRLSACTLTIHGLAYLNQLSYRYDLKQELGELAKDAADHVGKNAKVYDQYPLHILRTPCNVNYHPDNGLRTRIALYLHELTGLRQDHIKTKLPEVMPVWGKVHICMGDSIRSAMASSKHKEERDASYIRYELEYQEEDNDRGIQYVGYGQLQKIIVCQLPNHNFFGDYQSKTLLLALVTPLQTKGQDATKRLTSYTKKLAPIVMDLRSVKALIG